MHQTDGNAPELERAAKKLGLCVWPIGRPCDWLVTAFGVAVACEVKTDKGKLRPGQIKFLAAAGRAARVLRSTSDVIALYRDMRAIGEQLQNIEVGGGGAHSLKDRGRRREQ